MHRITPVNFAKFLRTPFLWNTSGRLLLKLAGNKTGAFQKKDRKVLVTSLCFSFFLVVAFQTFYVTFISFLNLHTGYELGSSCWRTIEWKFFHLLDFEHLYFPENIYNLKYLVLEVCIKTHNPLNQTLTFEGC